MIVTDVLDCSCSLKFIKEEHRKDRIFPIELRLVYVYSIFDTGEYRRHYCLAPLSHINGNNSPTTYLSFANFHQLIHPYTTRIMIVKGSFSGLVVTQSPQGVHSRLIKTSNHPVNALSTIFFRDINIQNHLNFFYLFI